VGLLAVAILVVNNLRDIRTDARTGKRTLAVRWGAARTRTFLALLLAGAFIGILFVALVVREPGPLIALFAAPGARAPLSLARSNKETDMLRALGATARLELVTGLLLAGGLLLAL
jgi:1,4-dihydroxy-2-naphthoate octaprenyltransferase